ncbi:MAG: ABC transporter ATP-binding protein [Alphaproteobacteria bacterium]
MQNYPGSNFVFLVRTAWRYAGLAERRRMAAFYTAFLVANIVLSFQPLILARLINAAQQGGEGAMQRIFTLSLYYGGLTAFFWLLHGPARLAERRVAFTVGRTFIASLYRIVTEMPLRWHQDHHSGGTINRIRKAEKALFQFSQGQFVTIQIMVRTFASIGMLAFFSVWVAVVSIISSLLIAMIIRRFDRDLVPVVRKTNEAEHHLSSALYDYIGNIVTVLTLRMQGNTGDEIQSRYEGIKKSFWREVVINEWKWGCISMLLIVVQMGIIGVYIAADMARGQAIALGSVVAIFQYLLTIMQQFFQGSQTFEQQLYYSIDVHGVDGLIADHARFAVLRPPATKQDWKKIRIDNLIFTHHEGEDALHHLRGVRLTIKAGQKIAFVGSSGSGKTTFLTLLRGLYDAQSVDLSIDGQHFSTLAPLSGFTTLVPQDSEVFENTVHYNLTFGTHIAKNILRQALSISAFDEVLPKLPQGLDTDIRERGVNMSGGQKQRLALARGLIAAQDASLLLLDEPTSSIDQVTESGIFDRLFNQFADKAIIATVHRLHLLPRFDHILLMENGAIVEQGDFATLLAQQGKFGRLWAAHLGRNEEALVQETELL